MYKLPYYHEEDEEIVKQFVRDNPFAFLSGVNANNEPVATQIPMFIDERDGKFFLSGHIMRNTDHHKAFEQTPHVLTVFTGANTYVSGTWYDNPYQPSTWNFMSVHAKGTIRFGNDEELIAILKRLSLHYENNNSNSTTIYDNLPIENTARLIKAIVAFEIEITSLEHVFKLSQDRDEKSYDNIVDKLKVQGGDAEEIAVIMENRKSKVFKS